MFSHCKGTAGHSQSVPLADPGAALENSGYSHQGPTAVAEEITEKARRKSKSDHIIASQ
jgi:hypothetical protein